MSAAVELASVGVTANIVYPPVTDTGWVTEDVRRYVEGRQDLVHIAEPSEVARDCVPCVGRGETRHGQRCSPALSRAQFA
jgi:hypothetical protein